MPKVLAQSNLPKSAAVVVSSETIVLRDPNNSILEKYTSVEQKQLSLKSYGIKPATLLSPGDNKKKPEGDKLLFFDWLLSDGNAYINTSFLPRADYKYEVDFELVSGSSVYPFGVQYFNSDDTNNNGRFGIVASSNEDGSYDYHLYLSSVRNSYTNLQGLERVRHYLLIENGSVKVDEGEVVELINFNSSLKIGLPLFIFGENRNGTLFKQGRSRLYSFKVYDSLGNLKLDLKPATLNDTPGCYDSVTKHFLENANSAGAFLIGNIGDTAGFGFGFNPSPEVTPNEED